MNRLGRLTLALLIPMLIVRQVMLTQGTLDLHTRGDLGAASPAVLFAMCAAAAWVRAGVSGSRVNVWTAVAFLSAGASAELSCNIVSWVARESVRSPLGVWWVQLSAALIAFSLLRVSTRIRPGTGSIPAGAA